jgi:hypothetical protein
MAIATMKLDPSKRVQVKSTLIVRVVVVEVRLQLLTAGDWAMTDIKNTNIPNIRTITTTTSVCTRSDVKPRGGDIRDRA